MKKIILTLVLLGLGVFECYAGDVDAESTSYNPTFTGNHTHTKTFTVSTRAVITDLTVNTSISVPADSLETGDIGAGTLPTDVMVSSITRTAITSIDGTGSGFDADLLDGVEGAGYTTDAERDALGVSTGVINGLVSTNTSDITDLKASTGTLRTDVDSKQTELSTTTWKAYDSGLLDGYNYDYFKSTTEATADYTAFVSTAGDTMSGNLNMGSNDIYGINKCTATYFYGQGSSLTEVKWNGVSFDTSSLTAGDLIRYDGTDFVRIASGTTVGQYLKQDFSWDTPAGAGDVTAAEDEVITGDWNFNNTITTFTNIAVTGDANFSDSDSTVTISGDMILNGQLTSHTKIRAYRNGAQSDIATGWQKILLNAESYDTKNEFCVTAGTFTATVAGYYQVNGAMVMTGIVSGEDAAIVIYKNGTLYSHGDYISVTDVYAGLGVSDIIYMNGTTDYLELWSYHQTTATADISGDEMRTFMSISRVP